jgi:signal transduction histidine kinase
MVTELCSSFEVCQELVTDEKCKKVIDSEKEVLRVIDRQLQYSREYQEMGIHPPQWVNLPRIIHMIVSSRGIGSMKFTMDIGDLELYCDPIIEKVFSHLVDNTLKHAKRATGILVGLIETAEGLVITYEDDGVGIPEEKKKDLFVQEVGASTGLSLFLIHDILEISDMTIRETGEPGKGARFEIYVPKGRYRNRKNAI